MRLVSGAVKPGVTNSWEQGTETALLTACWCCLLRKNPREAHGLPRGL